MRFLADSMLGKLARWLRMLGHDVIYEVKLDDQDLLKMAKLETRVLLTKDFELYKRAVTIGIDSYFVKAKLASSQLAELAERFHFVLTIDMDKSHCPICNSMIFQIPKDQILGELEKNTITFYEKFWRCPNCCQIYWQGSHWKQITNTLNEANKSIEKLEKKA